MDRRSFIRSLGGAVAASLVGFVPAIKLSAPKKAKAVENLTIRYFGALKFGGTTVQSFPSIRRTATPELVVRLAEDPFTL